jgi:tetratricopeptide (TPR) repeat protein
VADSINNLAELRRAQGRYAEAEPLYQRSLEIWERTLGPEHPSVAQGLENYAALLRAMGRVAEAEELVARARAIRTGPP